ncbi:hypothetical protein BDV59DRAFT_204629 [Aspergillus ambiguus]|uniref:uncharacterized protein n=1 Tax=Aspergillus ambiguus TaxID=176160 RepID=UPI003CCD9C87
MVVDVGLCADPNYVFANFTNLMECDTAHGFGYERTESNPYTRTVWNCVNEYCKSPDPSLNGCRNYYHEPWPGGRPFNFTVDRELQSLESYNVCFDIKNEANADIAGPGVYISYLLQLGIVFYLFLFLRAFRLIPTLVAWTNRLKHNPRPDKTTQTAMRRIFTQHDLALRTVLYEFQEAQCWFILVSLAAILAAQQYTRVYEASTLQALWSNQAIAAMVVSAGIIPILMGAWSLQKWHRLTPWIFFLSCATFILAEVTLYTLQTPEPSLLAPIEGIPLRPSCGGHAPPLIYCLDPGSTLRLLTPAKAFQTRLNPACLAIWASTVIMWAWTFIGEHAGAESGSRRGVRRRLASFHARVQQRLRERWPAGLLAVLALIIELLLVAAVCLDAINFWRIKRAGAVNFADWAFGQLIAIAVWLPVVSKYCLILGGIESYSYSRFPRPYKIIKEPEEEPRKDFEFTPLPT